MRRIFHAMTMLVLAVILAAGVRTQAIAEVVEEVVGVEAGAPEAGPVEDASSEGDEGAAPSEGDVEAVVPEDDTSEPEDQVTDAALDQDAPDVVTEEDSLTDDEVQPDEPTDALEEDEPVLDAQAGEGALAAAAGVSFVDVRQGIEHREDIIWLAESDISEGWLMPDGTRQFRPYGKVKRCDMAAFLFRLAKLWGLVTDDWQPTGAASFSDVNGSTSHYREVMWLGETRISLGWDNHDGTFSFKPYSPIKRADMAAFLARLYVLSGGVCTGSRDFVDVSDATPHVDEIRWLAASEISQGWLISDDRAEFRPLKDIVRMDMAAFLHRLHTFRQSTVHPYTIRFSGNGGSGTMADQTAYVGRSAKLKRNRYSRVGYQFMAWNTKSNGTGTYYLDGQEVIDLAGNGGRVVLHAQWVRPGSNYTIKFDANGGTGTMADQTARRGTSTKLNKLAFTHEWAYFTGWNTKSDGSGIAIEPSGYVTNPVPYEEGATLSFGNVVTLYAQWKQVSNWYRIDIWPNGGDRKPGYQIGYGDWKWINLNTYGTIEPNIYVRDGYEFAGWNTKPDGTGVPYEEEELVYNLSGDFGLYDLYAQWVKVD